jgi:hypothetical protein
MSFVPLLPGAGLAPFVVKVRFGHDIRRITVHNTDLTFDDLTLMLQRLFRERLHSGEDILIKYEDEGWCLLLSLVCGCMPSLAPSLAPSLPRRRPRHHDQQ